MERIAIRSGRLGKGLPRGTAEDKVDSMQYLEPTLSPLILHANNIHVIRTMLVSPTRL